jgi:hypothetical protein
MIDSRSARAEPAMIAASVLRLSYALGLLLAPDSMSKYGLAAPANGSGYARMTTRAFGAAHSNLCLFTLRAAVQNRDQRLVLRLNLGCDLGDLIATLLEWRTGDLPAAAAVGSVVLQSAGIATWGALLSRWGSAAAVRCPRAEPTTAARQSETWCRTSV